MKKESNQKHLISVYPACIGEINVDPNWKGEISAESGKLKVDPRIKRSVKKGSTKNSI